MEKKKLIFNNEIGPSKVWLFPDNVDTDVISPGKYLDDVKATLEHTCDTLIKEFPREVKEGDVIVAGRNFGCGSSRETAPIILSQKGIRAIVAESFARIFYRSSFAIGLPLFELEGVSKEFKTGDEIEINVSTAEIVNKTSGKTFKATPIPDLLLDILKSGGLEKKLLDELRAKGKQIKKEKAQ
ncbi:MAG: LeuD/DmdB family oxidoreductase small subunit [Candidatus Helarchaeota archaeon]